ncbi:MAG: DUF262 domain-containing protein [Rhodocyclaceae bacterium]|nr:DUF262 domain-containing protein [Rhodocyclaceae bacterium]MCA3019991.1 DUF262 domain-containing protein [Rhodocyclaceae bacterium]MCA3021039.1 DUF262 domain-containing protein [Rhodocyclaceae bacterium]MCA3025381.1 DUF262 domain-containing protein [Rhodocyclaceae bacterium]MCA3031599.1 DUF262 domain-containing protein [Rhodocyclaceae bacterium]
MAKKSVPAPPELAKDVQQEIVDDVFVDIEKESGEADLIDVIDRPYDPTLIRVDAKMFSLRNVLDMIDEGDLDLNPDFQRLRVWSPLQKSRLIESILLRIPLPAFYFSTEPNGKLQVVDGVQRLSTIHSFVRGGEGSTAHFRLESLEYLNEAVGGKYFGDLKNSIWAKRINTTQIVANVIDPQTPAKVKFDIFRRINTGGTPLNAQEIRHCMSGEKSRELLRTLASSKEFKLATGGKLSGHKRMADRELVLRAIAFTAEPSLEKALEAGSLENLLNLTAEKLDAEYSPEQLQLLSMKFKDSMLKAHLLFGDRAFRKWPTVTDWKYPLNRALFDVWGSLLASYSVAELEGRQVSIVEKFRELCAFDVFFREAISSGTSDPKKITYRFNAIREILSE